MAELKQIRRTPEQIAADLDLQINAAKKTVLDYEEKKAASVDAFNEKISKAKERVQKLEQRKKDVLTPKKRKSRKSKTTIIKELVTQAAKAGLKPEEIAEKLGVSLTEE